MRTLEEETGKEYEPYISEEAQEELDDPFSYEKQEETNKSYEAFHVNPPSAKFLARV